MEIVCYAYFSAVLYFGVQVLSLPETYISRHETITRDWYVPTFLFGLTLRDKVECWNIVEV